MRKIRSDNTKRVYFAVAAFFGLILAGLGFLGYMLTRDPGLAWEPPNPVEAELALKQIAFYKKSKAEGVRGWVKISEVELNSYLQSVMTNQVADAEIPPTRFPMSLKQVGVSLQKRELTIYSWGEARIASIPIPFVVQRTVSIHQEGTNRWDFPMQAVRVGEVEIPKRLWRKLGPTMRALDAPIIARLAWTTNINAMLVSKNELSQRSELHLYTYAPIPAADLR